MVESDAIVDSHSPRDICAYVILRNAILETQGREGIAIQSLVMSTARVGANIQDQLSFFFVRFSTGMSCLVLCCGEGFCGRFGYGVFFFNFFFSLPVLGGRWGGGGRQAGH